MKENRVVHGDVTMAEFVAKRVSELNLEISAFLGPSRTLVPVPRSSLQHPGALWPAKEIALALQTRGMGRVMACLSRARPLPKAATSVARDRPKAADHLASLQVRNVIDIPSDVTLIDDVITRGAQAMGAAQAIWSVRPDVSIRLFAVLRTISNEDDFAAVLAPVVGSVTLRGPDSFRAP